jgi:uncharacterized integral membrane protein
MWGGGACTALVGFTSRDGCVKQAKGKQEECLCMGKRSFSTSMGIAITILLAGVVVQTTDQLELFGKNSYIPLLIGLIIIVVGTLFVLLLRRIVKTKEP